MEHPVGLVLGLSFWGFVGYCWYLKLKKEGVRKTATFALKKGVVIALIFGAVAAFEIWRLSN